MPFKPVQPGADFPKLEESVLDFWRENRIYEQSLKQRDGQQRYVFYEGPPTANGKPHPGHCLTRAIKDLFPRYKTMRGFFCERKAGWDTHGLPVETEVSKELGIHSKEDIEAYGIEPFIHKCQQSVWQYMQQWEQLTERLGFWVKLDEAYVTYHQSYVESVWWSLAELWNKGLLYEGHKIIWWWAQGGTALSAGEVGQGYKTVKDPSVFVLFPLVDQTGYDKTTSLLVWTTTPWTLPSNQFSAVNETIEYAVAYDSELDQNIILAKDLVESIGAKLKRELEVKSTMMGSELVGKRYVPPFDYYYKDHGDSVGNVQFEGDKHLYWRIVSGDFVTTDSGTGAVHIAPAFGEVDYEIYMKEYFSFATVTEAEDFVSDENIDDRTVPKLLYCVAPNGKFTEEAPDFEGQWVKDCDKAISRQLKEKGKLYLLDQYEHEYPFCWRADDDPLIQYPRRSWFIRTTQHKDDMLANNQQINWLPEHIKDGRFGNFLESNVDWALSRERYWGTPLPIWRCEETGKFEAIGCYDELTAKPGATGMEVWLEAKAADPSLVEDLKVHKPYIDHVTYDSPHAAGAKMIRVTEVIDCWYDSGAMPFAQWGYPHKGHEEFKAQFPADFISEALDQTRGWFYSQLAISTLLFGDDQGGTEKVDFPHPFRNCIVLGLMLGEDGKKMSKSKGNYREPREIFDKYGADALRWYFYANQPPWTAIRYREQTIKDSIPEFILRMWNVYSFFVLYSNIDEFDPASIADPGDLAPENLAGGNGFRPIAERGELDRWIISELNRTLASVVEKMDAYDNYGAARAINEFVDVLSNWYVRRSRDRFWAGDKQSPEKLDAYWTLYECLTTAAKMVAPFVPFISEVIWQNLTSTFGDQTPSSVHLCDYPTANDSHIDADLSRRMSLLREIASLGLSARASEKLKVRQPLSGVTVILNDTTDQAWLAEHDELLKTELNVQDVNYTTDAGKYVSYSVVPNFKRLGPRVGKLMPQVKKAFGTADAAAMMAELADTAATSIEVAGESITLDNEDIEVRLAAKDGWAAAQGSGVVVVLATELTPELVRAGLARDLVRLIQDHRKALDLDRSDRISLTLFIDSEQLSQSANEAKAYICNETLAPIFNVLPLGEAVENAVEKTVVDDTVKIHVERRVE